MPSEFAIIGLGKIGGNLARQAVEKGYRVVGIIRHGVPNELIQAGAGAIADLTRCLSLPRIVLLYVPAGAAIDEIISELELVLSEGDVVIDGGDSYWGDSNIVSSPGVESTPGLS